MVRASGFLSYGGFASSPHASPDNQVYTCQTNRIEYNNTRSPVIACHMILGSSERRPYLVIVREKTKGGEGRKS